MLPKPTQRTPGHLDIDAEVFGDVGVYDVLIGLEMEIMTHLTIFGAKIAY